MGFLKDLFTGVKDFVTGDFGNVAEKIIGIPDSGVPSVRGGSELGMDERAYMDAAYPGTTPFERLTHSSGNAAIQSAELSRESAKEMQQREFAQQARITNMNNRAQVISSLGPVNAMALSRGLEALDTGSVGGDYESQTTIAGKRVSSEIESHLSAAKLARERAGLIPSERENIDAKTKLTNIEAERERMNRDLDIERLPYEKINMPHKYTAQTIGDYSSAMMPFGIGAFLSQRGKKPERYGSNSNYRSNRGSSDTSVFDDAHGYSVQSRRKNNNKDYYY